jgi:hypothetical protein
VKEIRYITRKEGLWFAFATLIIIFAIYLVPVIYYARGSKLFYQIIAFSFFSCVLMFFWRVRVGEIAWVTIVGFDTGLRCSSGGYLMPSLLPFLRSWDIILGCGAEVPTTQNEGNTVNIRQFADQRMKTYHVTMQTGLLAGTISQILANILFFMTDLRDADGRVKYYKLGGIGYVVSLIAAMLPH